MAWTPSLLSTPTVLTLWQAWTANGTWVGPGNLYGPPGVYCTGESGNAGTSLHGSHAGGGSGAGAFGGEPALGGVVAGTVLTITVPQGGTGNPTTVIGGAVTVAAAAGASTGGQAGAAGGAAGLNTIAFKGGDGASGNTGNNQNGGAGGGSAGSTGAGGNASLSAGGTAGTGAAGPPSLAGAAGASGGGASANGVNGTQPGSGASGGGSGGSLNHTGGSGVPGQVIIVWQVLLPGSVLLSQTRPGARHPVMHGGGGISVPYIPGPPVPPPPPSYGPARQQRPGRRGPGMRGAAGVLTPTAPGAPVPPPPPARGPVRQQRPGQRHPAARGTAGVWSPSQVSVVNQWAGTFSQPAAFGTSPPALQSVPVALTPASSVGGGTGYSTPGNWLFCITGINEPVGSGVTTGTSDDIHSFWRPGDVTASSWAVSTAAAPTRTSIWYTPNIARQVNDVYVAPSGCADAISVLVIEITGIGPWDTVTGIFTGYVAASAVLNLTLPAPAAAAFFLAAACGDSATAGQVLAPPAWTSLQTVTASNGADHTCDSVLTSACFTTASGVSVDATAASPSDMSGVIIGVLYSAPSPVTAGANPSWAQRVIMETALGAGYETPPDQCTWTVMSDSAWPGPWGAGGKIKRFWGWRDTSAIPWGLGQYQSASGVLPLENADGALSPSNVGSPFYSTALNANMSFQSGTAPWTASGGAAITQSASRAFASAGQGLPQCSLQVTPGGPANPGAVSEKITVTGGTAYSASAWFWSAAGWPSGAQVIISWYTAGGTLISSSASSTVPVPAGAWTRAAALDQGSPPLAAAATVTIQFAGTPPAAFWAAEAALAAGAAAVQTGLVTGGTPVRVRMALGTVTTREGSAVYNRWYCWQRNVQSWPEKRNKALRGYVEATTTDPWQSASGTCPTPYRGEVEQDNPGWWWPCDDQALAGGVLPVSLRNAAKGSTTVLNIVPSPSGVASQDSYSSGLGGAGGGGVDVTSAVKAGAPPSVATYAVAASQGWMYGDPQVSPQSAQTGNPVTAQPGSAAWQQSGLLGNTGSAGWVLIANDTFPPIAGGVTVSGWFNYAFLGTAASSGLIGGTTYYDVAGQPYCPLTLCELATGTAPVALLQLDISGHLNLITYNGATPTSHAIYTTSDLRCNAFIRVTMELTQSTYTVHVNGSLTASASGSCTISASAWQWLIAGGDLGSNGGSLTGTGLQHGGNVAISHLQVYAGLLPAWRERAHYSAAITGCGLLPAPTGMQAATVANFTPSGFTPDGTAYQGSYASGTGGTPFTVSALAVAVAGPYTSGPAARTTIAGRGGTGSVANGAAAFVGWNALAPLVQVYTSASANTEREASAVLGSGETYNSGYGSGASGIGTGHVSGGTGAAPPAGPSALGDTVQQRLERILSYGGITLPMRAIDPAPLQVQAALDVGGRQVGASVQAIVASDNGWWFTDTAGVMNYRSRPHLNADTPVWFIGMNVAAGMIPFAGDVTTDTDIQRVFPVITVAPYSPDGASLAELVPADFAAAAAAEAQYGPHPLAVTSYLQGAAGQQAQADFLLAYYGTPRKRVVIITIDAARHPAAWGFVLGANLADQIVVYDAPLGSPPSTTTYRISSIQRSLSYGANGSSIEGRITVAADPLPPTGYWT